MIKRSAQLSSDGVLEIAIYDYIGEWFFGVTPAWVRAQILAAGNLRRIDVLINSPGGDAHEGVAIYNELRNSGVRVQVKVMGLAASAASTIAMAGDKIVMMRGAMMMIHEVAAIMWGSAAELEAEAVVLRKLNWEAAGIYAARGGAGRERFLELMAAETWLTGGEAKGLGLADAAEGHDAGETPALQPDQAVFDAARMKFKAVPEEARRFFVDHVDHVEDLDGEARRKAGLSESRERRSFEGVELRVDAGLRTIEGMIPYDQEAEIRRNEFEVIRRGAFDEAIKGAGDDDVFAFWNHNSDVVLGRAGNRTLDLFDTPEGLQFIAHVPASAEGESKLESVRRGDVKGASFAFNVKSGGEKRSARAGGGVLRELTAVKLWEVSPGVPFPAYAGASARGKEGEHRGHGGAAEGHRDENAGEDAREPAGGDAGATRSLEGETLRDAGLSSHAARRRRVGVLIGSGGSGR